MNWVMFFAVFLCQPAAEAHKTSAPKGVLSEPKRDASQSAPDAPERWVEPSDGDDNPAPAIAARAAASLSHVGMDGAKADQFRAAVEEVLGSLFVPDFARYERWATGRNLHLCSFAEARVFDLQETGAARGPQKVGSDLAVRDSIAESWNQPSQRHAKIVLVESHRVESGYGLTANGGVDFPTGRYLSMLSMYQPAKGGLKSTEAAAVDAKKDAAWVQFRVKREGNHVATMRLMLIYDEESSQWIPGSLITTLCDDEDMKMGFRLLF